MSCRTLPPVLIFLLFYPTNFAFVSIDLTPIKRRTGENAPPGGFWSDMRRGCSLFTPVRTSGGGGEEKRKKQEI